MNRVWDYERRLTDPEACATCTTSIHNSKEGADQWSLYKHLYYLTKIEQLKSLKPHPDDLFYQCKPCSRTHLVRDMERVPLILG